MDTTAYASIDFLHVITPIPKRHSNCYNSRNEVQAHLAAIGCNGQKILRAHLAAIRCNGNLTSDRKSLPLVYSNVYNLAVSRVHEICSMVGAFL